MVDFEDEIRKRPAGPFAGIERQTMRFFTERDMTRERFIRGAMRWIAYLGTGVGLAVGATSLWRMW